MGHLYEHAGGPGVPLAPRAGTDLAREQSKAFRMPTFLVVEVPTLETPAAAFTRTHPGVALDFFGQTERGLDGGPLRVITQALGGPPHVLVELLHLILERYPGTQVLAPPDAHGEWTAAFEVPMSPEDEITRAVMLFTDQHNLRMRWGRIEEGTGYMRAMLPDDADAERVADQFRQFLKKRGLDADVAIEVEDEERLTQWVELMRRIVAPHLYGPDKGPTSSK